MKTVRVADKRLKYYAEVLKVLGSSARLRIVRLLIQYADQGCCVTDIQKELGCANSTLSHHLDSLARVGLIHSRKQAQWIFYSVNFGVLKELLNFLWQDCCSRSPWLVELESRPSPVSQFPKI